MIWSTKWSCFSSMLTRITLLLKPKRLKTKPWWRNLSPKAITYLYYKDFSDEDIKKLYATYEYDMILLFDNTYSKRKAEIASPNTGVGNLWLESQMCLFWWLQLNILYGSHGITFKNMWCSWLSEPKRFLGSWVCENYNNGIFNLQKKHQSLKIPIEIRLRILEFVHLSNTHLSSILFHFCLVFSSK